MLDQEKDHYVLFFASDNTYDVIQKDKCDEFNAEKNTVKVFYPRSKKNYEGEIIYERNKYKSHFINCKLINVNLRYTIKM